MKSISKKFSSLLVLSLGLLLLFVFAASAVRVASADEVTRLSVINNDKTMEGTRATEIVPEGHDGEDCNGGVLKSVVCNQLGWRPFPDVYDLSDFDKDSVVFDLWMYLSDRQGIDGFPYSANNIGFVFANDISSWDDRKYIPWFPTRAELTPESGGMGDGWNHISVKLSLLPEDRTSQFANLDMSSIYIYVMCTTIDDLYIHDAYFTENAEQDRAVAVYSTQGFTDADRPLPKTMTLDTDSVTLEKDDTYTLQASVRPYSSKPEMRFVSDAPSVASVSSDGVITGVKEGNCVITVKVVNVTPAIIAKVKVTVKDSIPLNPQNVHEINVDTCSREAAFAPDYTVNGNTIKGSSGIYDFAPDGDGRTVFAHFYSMQSAGSLDHFNIKSFNLKNVVLQFNMFIADKTLLSYGDAYSGFRLSPPTSLNWGTDYYRAPITEEMYNSIVSGWNRITIRFPYFVKVGNPSASGLSFLITQSQDNVKDYEIGFNDVRVYEGTLDTDYTVEPLVQYKAADSIEITGETNVAKGKSVQLSATVLPEDSTMARYYVFESSDTSVATVTRGGLLNAKSAGQVTITAKTLDGITRETVTVNVTDTAVMPKGITLSGIPKKPAVGETFNMKVSFDPQNVDDTEVIYYSDNVSVAVVDGSGKVTVVGDGKAKITVYSAADSKVSASFTLTTKGYRSTQCDAAIISGTVGGVVVAAAGVFLGVYLTRKKKSSAETEADAETDVNKQ